MSRDRVIDGDVSEHPSIMSQIEGNQTLVEIQTGFLGASHWSDEYTGLEIHLDGGHDPLIIQGTLDDKGNEATVGTWLSVEAARELGESLIEAADRVEAARKEDIKPEHTKKGLLERAKKSVVKGKDD